MQPPTYKRNKLSLTLAKNRKNVKVIVNIQNSYNVVYIRNLKRDEDLIDRANR